MYPLPSTTPNWLPRSFKFHHCPPGFKHFKKHESKSKSKSSSTTFREVNMKKNLVWYYTNHRNHSLYIPFQLHILEVVVLVVLDVVLDVVLEVACAIPMQSLCSFQVFKRILPFASHSSVELWNLRYETHSDIGIPIQHLQEKMFNFS